MNARETDWQIAGARNVMAARSSRPATFVLVPGAGGQAWYWHRVVPELEARGHTGANAHR